MMSTKSQVFVEAKTKSYIKCLAQEVVVGEGGECYFKATVCYYVLKLPLSETFLGVSSIFNTFFMTVTTIKMKTKNKIVDQTVCDTRTSCSV